jgi:hypothetical protein
MPIVSPEEIRTRSERLYPKLLQAWSRDDPSLFPLPLRGVSLSPEGMPVADAIEAVNRLRQGSREHQPYGYRVEWQEHSRGKLARQYGRNEFPKRIDFETQDDLLRYLGKRRQFARFVDAATKLRTQFPQLAPWLARHVLRFEKQHVPHIDGLLETAAYFQRHPRPGCFARELPLSTDTKFIEAQRSVLSEWLDVLLPPEAIDSGIPRQDFALRYGLRVAEGHRMIRLLDEGLADELGLGCTELSLPLRKLAALAPRSVVVVVVENKTNLLTLPPIPRGIGLFGEGYNAAPFAKLGWLADHPLLYWGDLDLHGLRILAQLRGFFSHVESLWMDSDALSGWEDLLAPRTHEFMEVPRHLTPGEEAAFIRCRDEGLWLEQERIPQPAVRAEFARRWGERGD